MKNIYKKSLSVFLAITIILCSAYVGLSEIDLSGLFAVEAKATSESDLSFTLNDDGLSYSVAAGKTSISGSLIIPSTYNGLPITSIGYEAFESCTSLTSVKIPDSVTRIGDYAFYDCEWLASITIPDSVTSIGRGAFTDTKYYNNNSNWGDNGVLYINNHLIKAKTGVTSEYVDAVKDGTKTISSSAFEGCTILASVKIPNSVTGIGDRAFYGCTSLTSITIPDGVTNIGASTFYNCKQLTTIIIPDSVTNIGESAFYNCTQLATITIPDSVTSIGYNAFTNTKYYNNESNWENNVLYINNHLIKAKTSFYGAHTVKEGTKTIGPRAFEYCTTLRSIIIPNSLVTIGDAAFNECSQLGSVELGNSVESIGAGAFWFANFSTITIPASVRFIGDDAFMRGEWLADINVDKNNLYYSSENGVLFNKDKTTLIKYPGEKSNTEYIIPDSVTTIEENAFDYCERLTSIKIPDSVTSIGFCAFSDCKNLKKVYITDIAAWCGISFEDFSSTSLYFDFSSNPLYYANNLYINDELVAELEIPLGVTAVPMYAFSCENITSVKIPNSVTSIGTYAFRDCTGLTSIEFPNSVTSIGAYAFDGCTKLTTITIPENVISIGSGAFYDCTGLEKINWNPKSFSDFTDSSEIFYNAGANSSGIEVVFGDTVERIPAYLFSASEYTQSNVIKSIYPNVIKVVISDNVKSIGYNAFYKCFNLSGVYITDIVAWCEILFSNIESNPLYYAGNLYLNGKLIRNLIIPDTVTSISDYAFGGCVNLTSITIPNSVTTVSNYAFCYCTNLTSISIPDSVISIGDYAFRGCTGLGTIKIPNSIKSIGACAFMDCTRFTSIKIPNSVTSIGDYAFYNCKSLFKIVIPESVTSFGYNVFYNNSGDFTIYCFRDTHAMQYAIDNSLRYFIMDIGETENSIIDYKNKVIYLSAYGVTDLEDVIYIPATSDAFAEASFLSGANEFLGTGSVVYVFDVDNYSEYTIVVEGDTNGDSVCDALDAWQVGLASNGHKDLDGAYAMAADSNEDEVIDATDLQSIVNKAVS